jgi:hypothetical protein
MVYRHEGLDYTPIYIALGMFAVEFEKISTALRHAYSTLMKIDGLRTWGLGTNLLNLPQLGPAILAQAFCAGVHQVSADAEFKSRASKLVTACQKLAEERNDVLHGEWMIGSEVVVISHSSSPPAPHGIKRKTSKEGEKVRELPEVSKLEDLVSRSRDLQKEIREISAGLLVAHFKAHPERYTAQDGE